MTALQVRTALETGDNPKSSKNSWGDNGRNAFTAAPPDQGFTLTELETGSRYSLKTWRLR